MVRSGSVTVDGERADLLEYATARRENLILKPTAMHGGLGVVMAGWLTGPQEWEQQLRASLNGPWVLQRRIRPVPELFPGEDGPQPWVLTWGAFLCGRGYGGMWVRGDRRRRPAAPVRPGRGRRNGRGAETVGDQQRLRRPAICGLPRRAAD
jgi:hypothetical protein